MAEELKRLDTQSPQLSEDNRQALKALLEAIREAEDFDQFCEKIKEYASE